MQCLSLVIEWNFNIVPPIFTKSGNSQKNQRKRTDNHVTGRSKVWETQHTVLAVAAACTGQWIWCSGFFRCSCRVQKNWVPGGCLGGVSWVHNINGKLLVESECSNLMQRPKWRSQSCHWWMHHRWKKVWNPALLLWWRGLQFSLSGTSGLAGNVLGGIEAVPIWVRSHLEACGGLVNSLIGAVCWQCPMPAPCTTKKHKVQIPMRMTPNKWTVVMQCL